MDQGQGNNETFGGAGRGKGRGVLARLTSPGVRWPAAVGSLLLLNVSICFITVYSAVTNPVSIEDDYYQQAVDWDDLRASSPSAASVGWMIDAELVGPNAEHVMVSITTDGGKPLDVSRIEGLCFHQAFARDRRALAFERQRPGVFRAAWPSDVQGLWELRIGVESAGTRARAIVPVEWRGVASGAAAARGPAGPGVGRNRGSAPDA
ncbi:MAG: FixH family protein [Planctomycetota bacterium]